MIAGDILIIGNGRDPIQHNGVHLLFDGMVNINLSSKNVGVFEAFYNSAKVINISNVLFSIVHSFMLNVCFQPIQLINYSVEVSKAGKLAAGKTEIPFEIPLRVKSSMKHLYETYHGVFINIQVNL